MVEALAAKARSVTVGNGLDEGVELGPTVFRTRSQTVKQGAPEAW